MLVFEGQRVPKTCLQPLSNHGVRPTSTLQVLMGPRTIESTRPAEAPLARIKHCAPPQGPVTGGPVTLHGEGFTVDRGFDNDTVRVLFGPEFVRVRRVSDTMLVCEAPAHAPGIVSVKLHCSSSVSTPAAIASPVVAGTAPNTPVGTGSGAPAAALPPSFAMDGPVEPLPNVTYAYVSMNAMYDFIFASTNANCPVKDRLGTYTLTRSRHSRLTRLTRLSRPSHRSRISRHSRLPLASPSRPSCD
jgi:hypothetical protein